MIGYIKGTVEGILADSVLVENNGIGYHIYTSGMVLGGITGLHQEMMMYTHLHVREDELTLFGFPTTEELDTFRLLLGVNGIGPKAALAVLSVLSVRDLAMAIMAGDTKAITRANGIGAKGAGRIIMELKDKLAIEDLFVSEADASQSGREQAAGNNDSIQDTVLALVSLGYSEFEALKAVKQIPGAESMESGDLLKAALKKMF
ncbi:MAG: Holliday junction branch migration protein RuvA [Bacteroidales bacterium]|nr:Holliday junction branch migration protein RuvA [Clostridium sp.]MCM1203092.1 Holliday junction branch migration protein RuvA [Bacteroidales bacterium]